MKTFYWHDYETWGTNPAQDRACQFAGIRTDLDFNIIGEPLVQYCRPPVDLLPHPEACLITGITPQLAQKEGLPEYEFIRNIHAELAAPGTCGAGYNSIRFDDEVTRYALYRNFYDPYAREWRNGNSRWDIIDMVRACRALRPDGIEWPNDENGKPSFKLERLTAANGLKHEAAHDALSDVHATIAVARLIRQKQPRLFDYLFKLRDKREVLALLNVVERKPLLHISGMFPAERGCAALIMPLAQHPANANEVICYDLSVDPTPLLELDAESIRRRVFATNDALDGERIPLKTVRANRCPVVATEKLLDAAVAERLQIDRAVCERHYQLLLAAKQLSAKLRDVFVAPERAPITDPEQMLYSGGFFSDADRATMQKVVKADGATLARQTFIFEDARLSEMLWRYRARNFPQTLSEDESEDWQQFCARRLTDPAAGGGVMLDDYRKRIAELSMLPQSDEKKEVLRQLSVYAESLMERFTSSPAQ